MADGGKLRDIESAWLLSIDALLMQNTPNAHAVAAARIVDHWFSGGQAFRRELTQRAKAWRKRQDQMVALLSDKGGVCHRLIRAMDAPPPEQDAPEQPSVGSRVPIVRPSRRPNMPTRRMGDKEVKKFMELIESEWLSSVFDPGVSVTTDDVLFYPPLIVIDRTGVFHNDIAPKYERREIDRLWAREETSPEWSLAVDLTLIIILRERRWTWRIADRYYKRMPWSHPAKTTPTGRPGWKMITGMLSDQGLIERRSGQTWRLTASGKMAAEQVLQAWRSVIEPS